MLTMAAEEADIVSLLVRGAAAADARTPADWTQKAFEQQLGWISDACRACRRNTALGLRVMFGRVLHAGRAPGSVVGQLGVPGLADTEALTSPFGLVGEESAIKDCLFWLRDIYGLSYFTLNEDLGWAMAPLVAKLAS